VRDPSGLTTVVEVASRRSEVSTLGVLLGEAPGVILQQTGGTGQAEQLSLRGASSTGVLVLLDGVPLNSLGGIADLSLVPLAAVQRAEVLRGGAGARYGAGALGGVVNLVTRSAAEPVISGDVGVGSFGTIQGGASTSGPVLGGSGLLELHAGHTDGDFPYLYDPLAGTPASNPKTLIRQNNQATWLACRSLSRPHGVDRWRSSPSAAAPRATPCMHRGEWPPSSRSGTASSSTWRTPWTPGRV
jgi:iron complex outermembrane receptor protein